MGEAVGRGMVMAFSIWMDGSSHMLWLDGVFPQGGDRNKPGVAKGPCADNSGDPEDIKRQAPGAFVAFSNIKVGPINTTHASLLQ